MPDDRETAELAHYRALAACARALLAGAGRRQIDEALHAVLEAAAATSLFVERNVDHPELGFATQMVHEVARPGIDTEAERWAVVGWSQLPDSRVVLARGEPFVLRYDELGPVEQATYAGSAMLAELDYPVFVDGEWVGLVGFSDDVVARERSDADHRLLSAVAELFAVLWTRLAQEDRLDRAMAAAEKRLAYERALAACSHALLAGSGEEALQTALDALLGVTGAQYGTIERNVEHAELGLCSQVLCRAVADPDGGPPSHGFDHYWFLVPWTRMPDSQARLAKGVPFAFRVAELGDVERELYDRSPVRTGAEIDIPVMVRDEWRGLIAFGFSDDDHDWAPEDTALFQTAADMIAAFWVRQEAQERLEDLIRSKDEFLAAVSHELRTPLTTVVGLAEELRDRPADFTAIERDELMALIAEQGLEMAHLVEDLLVAARADAGTIELGHTRVDVDREIAVVVSGVRSRKAVAIHSAGGCVAEADAMRTRQIIRNLVTNATRYGGPSVRADSWTDERYVFVAVSDDGPPVPTEARQRIFEPYGRAHHPTTQPASVGLGLTVARRLARLMDGDLRYHRRGGRNVFELRLPRYEPGAVGANGPTGGRSTAR